jgi:hypothetical protein
MKLKDILFSKASTTVFDWREIKYFSPSDNRNILPDGHPIAKGGFLKECRDNAAKFLLENGQYLIKCDGTLEEAIHPNQYGLKDYRGGLVIFSTDVNALQVSKNALINWFKKTIASLKNRLFRKSKVNTVVSKFNATSDKKAGTAPVEDYIGAFSVGNFFNGRYVGDNGKVFDEKSMAVEVNGISSEALIYLAEQIATEFHQETVLVKDLNKNKIYLANGDPLGNYDLSTVNQKSSA